MKIIERGTAPECGTPYRGSCTRCHCRVEAYGHELLPGFRWWWPWTGYWWVFCPTPFCMNRIEVVKVEAQS